MTTPPARQIVFEEPAPATKNLLHEGILDTFGQISAHDPDVLQSFSPARKPAPCHVNKGDMQRVNLKGEAEDHRPACLKGRKDGKVNKLRSDADRVSHGHSSAVPPNCVTYQPLLSVIHIGG